MKRILIFAAGISILAACSGFEQPGFEDNSSYDKSLVQKVVLEVLPIMDGDVVDTKASAVPDGNKVNFAWEITDTIGVYPDKGSQIYFLIDESSVGKSSASFDGGAWALKQNSTYISYFPLVGDFYLEKDKVPVSFAGQKQIGKSSPFNGARYYLATGPTRSENGILRFTYNTLNTIFNINATLPAGTYTKAMMTLNEPLFIEEGTYSLDDPRIVGTKYTNTLKIDLENVTLTSQGVLPIYLMSAPVDLRGKEVTIKVISSDGKKFECVKTLSKNYEAGTRYGLTCNEMTQTNAGNIVFADANIKAALVTAFDTEGDGELSYMEAAAVTSIDGVFGTKKTYTSFDEFQYFTGVTTIPDSMFEGWQITSIVLPESISSIGSYAFRDCVKLTSISIPDLVSIINMGVFKGCVRLSSISLPESLSRIRASAFYGCSSLTSITIPESVTNIDGSVFQDCTNLTSISLPESVTKINGSVFYNCCSLTSIYIPESVTIIEGYAFSGCSSLTSITIPESVTSIGGSAFYGCSSLTSFYIPEDVYRIEDYTFSSCSNLTSITIPESVTSIGSGAFANCISLASITIPESLTSLGGSAFKGCSNLTSIIIPEFVTSIGGSAFYDCSSLTSITIPESVASIGTYAFRNCFSLESITIPEAVTIIEDGTFRGCTSLATVTLPETVTKIGGQAFWECGNLLSVTIPSSVTSLGDRAFGYCSNLESIICLANTPPSMVSGGTFYRTNGCGIYVPAGSVSAYKAADGWSSYADRIYSVEGGFVPPSGDGGNE